MTRDNHCNDPENEPLLEGQTISKGPKLKEWVGEMLNDQD